MPSDELLNQKLNAMKAFILKQKGERSKVVLNGTTNIAVCFNTLPWIKSNDSIICTHIIYVL